MSPQYALRKPGTQHFDSFIYESRKDAKRVAKTNKAYTEVVRIISDDIERGALSQLADMCIATEKYKVQIISLRDDFYNLKEQLDSAKFYRNVTILVLSILVVSLIFILRFTTW